MLTFGQSLDVRSRDSRPYVPDLMGARLKAQLVAMPRGDAIHLYPEQPGRFQLVDSMRLFMLAEVLVVKFPTHAVTGLDGHFVIPHVPVGKVSVSALLPATMEQAQKEVEVHSGELVDVTIALPFDRKKWDAARGPTASFTKLAQFCSSPRRRPRPRPRHASARASVSVSVPVDALEPARCSLHAVGRIQVRILGTGNRSRRASRRAAAP